MKNHTMKLKATSLFLGVCLAILAIAASPAFAQETAPNSHRPPANGSRIPIAFASVSYDGSKQSGTSNVTSSYNSQTGLYQLKIAGICFLRTSYTTVATVSGYNGFTQGALFVNTDDGGHYCHETGDLIVGLRDVNGTLEKADFQVVVFQCN
jgi:hypothetical protein